MLLNSIEQCGSDRLTLLLNYLKINYDVQENNFFVPQNDKLGIIEALKFINAQMGIRKRSPYLGLNLGTNTIHFL